MLKNVFPKRCPEFHDLENGVGIFCADRQLNVSLSLFRMHP